MKTTIKIDDKYKIEVDEYNHQLFKYSAGGEMITVGKYKDQESKARWEPSGYFPNVNQCLRKIIFLESLGQDDSLQQYVDRLEALDEKYYGKGVK